MKVLEFRNINKKSSPLFYRREYKADVIVGFRDFFSVRNIEFVMELRAVGDYAIYINPPEKLEFPVLPYFKTLKSYINELEINGELP